MSKKKASDLEIDSETTEKVETTTMVNQLAMVKGLAKALNKEFGDDTVQLFESNEGHIDNVKDYVKTGVPVIDYILGGKGFPVGRVSELYGEPSSGKTAVAMHILKQTIDRGGLAVMLDSEATFSFQMASKIGLDRTKLAYIKPKTLEEIWRMIEQIINHSKIKAPNQLVTIVVDSIASAPSLDETENDIAKAEMGLRARINSKGLRKITIDISDSNICLILINQIRSAIGQLYGDPDMIPGGKAIEFHASLKLKISKGKVIREDITSEKTPIGQMMRLKVTKNKLADPYKEAELEFFFDRGVPVYSGLMEKMMKESVLIRKGSYLFFGQESFYAKDFDTFMEAHQDLLDFSTWKNYKVEKLDE
jgi:recombination protein RecA